MYFEKIIHFNWDNRYWSG